MKIRLHRARSRLAQLCSAKYERFCQSLFESRSAAMKRRAGLIVLVAAWAVAVITLFAQRDPGQHPFSLPNRDCDHLAIVAVAPKPHDAVRVDRAQLRQVVKARYGIVNPGFSRTIVVSGGTLTELFSHPFDDSSEIVLKSFVPGGLWVDGPVHFPEMVPVPVRLSGVYFAGHVDAHRVTFAHGLEMRDSSFAGSVDISGATVRESLDLRGGNFMKGVDLSGTHVDGTISLQGRPGQPAVFHGDFDASNMVIAGGRGVLTDHACFFPNRRRLATFQISSEVSWSNTHIEGGAQFGDSWFGSPVDFSGLIVRGAMSFSRGRVIPPADSLCNDCPVINFAGLHVDGPATFNGSVFQGCQTWDGASFGGLDFDVELQRDGCRADPWLSADGMSYAHVLTPHGVYGMIRFLPTLFSPKYNDRDTVEGAYVTLETTTRNQGYRHLANRIYVEGQRSQQQYLRSQPSQWLTVVGMGFVDGYIRYGRDPMRAIVICGLVIAAFGLFMRIMQELRRAPETLMPFQYSVTTFLSNNWHEKRKTPDLSYGLRILVVAYMLISISLFTVLIYYVSGDSWPAIIPIVAGALVPLGSRIGKLARRDPAKARKNESMV